MEKTAMGKKSKIPQAASNGNSAGDFEVNGPSSSSASSSNIPNVSSNGHSALDVVADEASTSSLGLKRKTRSSSIKSDPDSPPQKRGRVGNAKKHRAKKELDKSAPPKRKCRQSKPKEEMFPGRCPDCRQFLDDPSLLVLDGHPNHAEEEYIALTNDRLTETYGEVPENKLTQFSFYDKQGHLCFLDDGIIERDVLIYATGFIKPIYEDDASAEDGVPVKDLGPISGWWIAGYDGGERAIIGISTEFAQYLLMEPAPQYVPFFQMLSQKVHTAKLVVQFVMNDNQSEFEDLLNEIQTTVTPPGVPKITEDSLIRHAQFVCDQVASYEEAGDEDEDDAMTAAPCIRKLMSLGGASTRRGGDGQRHVGIKKGKCVKDKWTKATTTPLVNKIFDALFGDQIARINDEKIKGPKKLRCGVCSACQLPDCGTCSNCRDMVKFGGSGRNKQGCIKRKCPNMAVKDAANSDSESDKEDPASKGAGSSKGAVMVAKGPRSRGVFESRKEVTWIGEPVFTHHEKTYYKTAKIAGEEVSVGDFVSCEAADVTEPVVIGRIQRMYQLNKRKIMHLYWFARGSDTILGATADPQELFVVDECEKTALTSVIEKVIVHRKESSSSWFNEGGSEVELNPYEPNSFFYSKKYDAERGRFEDLPPKEENSCDQDSCPACVSRKLKNEFDHPCASDPSGESVVKNKTEFGVVRWRGEKYMKGSCVYLEPDTFKFKKPIDPKKNSKVDAAGPVDDEKYPELYRRVEDRRATEENPMAPPFCIGLISTIFASKEGKNELEDVKLRVLKFYRPENTVGIITDITQHDLTKLYASEEEVEVDFSRVKGRCFVAFADNIVDGDPCTWSMEGPDRFYFVEAYDSKKEEIKEPLRAFTSLGNLGKGGGKGKGKSARSIVDIPTFPKLTRPLKCLDVFAGCGGLSDGLHQSGVATSKWAIEKDESAAAAFQLNNPSATVLTDDCNDVLKSVISGAIKNNKGQVYPQKGDVELLVGGPPCQGFSGMNRFNQREYSAFKNSLVVSYLSYCDFYRPKYFILENVRNFCSFKKGMVLKLAMRCLLQMGYQVAVGVLQAGHYGVPQTRRRVIILAAAPGEVLPSFPEPRHVFNTRTGGLGIAVDDKKIVNGCLYGISAPLRSITVSDAMSDLPEIKNGHDRLQISYNSEPITHFQKLMREKSTGSMLYDHICKEMNELVAARMAHIPKTKNADWRNLPNIPVTLKDGTICKKLMYTHHDQKNGKSSTGSLRGVCSCAGGGKCDPMDRQFGTLIPWCLPHTSNRHNNWAGLYGRLQWSEYFRTTITNPEPMGKQGRVLHPTQDRVVSVRECARSQGFHDSYRFYGSIIDKHRQIGNAVPPPMGKALGLEISKALKKRKANDD